MNSVLILGLSIVVVVALSLLATLKTPAKSIAFLKDNPGEVKGIILMTAFIMILALSVQRCEAGFFEYGYAYVGLDYTKNVSPFCEEDGPSDRLTSNGGIVINGWVSSDERFHANGKYTHHSCELNPDRNSYDSLGAEVRYDLW